MDCPLIDGQLVEFHFATLDDGARATVEQHLLGCAGCLAGYLALKRAIETDDALPPASDTARARLRRAVALRLAARHPRRRSRRALVIGGLASVALAIALAFAADLGLHRGHAAAALDVDSAGGVPASLDVL